MESKTQKAAEDVFEFVFALKKNPKLFDILNILYMSLFWKVYIKPLVQPLQNTMWSQSEEAQSPWPHPSVFKLGLKHKG